MKIVILNGCPKGNDFSITIRHVLYLQKVIPEHEYVILPISRSIDKIRNDKDYFTSILNEIKKANLIIWAFPLYFYSIPAQLKQFIEIIFEKNKKDIFLNKYSTSISTSGVYCDNFAHDYINAISEDLGMQYIPGYSFESMPKKEIHVKENRESYEKYFKYLFKSVKEKRKFHTKFQKIISSKRKYNPVIKNKNPKSSDKKIILISDHTPGSNLDKMINVFVSRIKYDVEIIKLNELKVRNGCRGCVRCQFTGDCVINDDLSDVYKKKIPEADCIIIAATIKDRHFSSLTKAFYDGSFFIGQKPNIKPKYVAYIVSGPLSQCHLASLFIDIASTKGNHQPLGYISDEYSDSDYLTNLITDFTKGIEIQIEENILKPRGFFAKSYHLIMRDLLWIYASVKKPAYKHYKKYKLFDYPQKSIKNILIRTFYNFAFNFPLTRNKIKKNVLKILAEGYDT